MSEYISVGVATNKQWSHESMKEFKESLQRRDYEDFQVYLFKETTCISGWIKTRKGAWRKHDIS